MFSQNKDGRHPINNPQSAHNFLKKNYKYFLGIDNTSQDSRKNTNNGFSFS